MTDAFLLRLLVTQAWQIAVLTVIVAAAAKFLATRRPQLAHWLWLIVVLKCVTPPLWGHPLGLFSHIQSYMPAEVESDSSAGGAVDSSPAVASASRVGRRSLDLALPFDRRSPEIATVATQGTLETFGRHEVRRSAPTAPDTRSTSHKIVWWVLGIGMVASAILLTFRFVSCWRRIERYRVADFDSEIGLLVADLSRQLNLRRVPRVVVSDVRFGPAVMGIFRHLIVLPKCLVADENCREEKSLRPILAHELMHIRRGDLLTGTLQAVVQCLWWFHPAVWITNRLLSRETERCCDAQVVAELGFSPSEYARSLLTVIECKQSLKPVPVFPGMKPVEITSQRMERIMSLTQGSRTRTPWWSVLAVLLFAVVMLPGAVIAQQGKVEKESVAPTTTLPAPKLKLDPVTELCGDTVIAFVNGKKILVDDVAGNLLVALEAESKMSAEQRRKFLRKQVRKLLVSHIEQEIILDAYNAAVPKDRKALVEQSLEEPFQQVVANIKHDRRAETDEQLEAILAEDGLSIDLLRQSFFRIQIVQGYLSNLLNIGQPLTWEQRRDKSKNVIADLRAKATVVTMFDDETIVEEPAVISQGDEKESVPRKKETVADESMIGKAVASDAGVSGQVVYDECVVQVLGAVAKPGSYEAPRDGEFRLLDAVALAGGFVAPVDDSVILRRQTGTGDTSISLLRIDQIARGDGSNPALRDGDVIVVEKGKARTKFNLEREMEDALNRRISISFKDMPYQEILRKLATESGLNIILDTRAIEAEGNELAEKRISLEMKDVEVRKVLNAFCLQLDLTFEVQFDSVRITNPGSDLSLGLGNALFKSEATSRPAQSWPSNRHLPQVASEHRGSAHADFVVAVARKLARQFDANIVIERNTLEGLNIPQRERLTLNFDNVGLKPALDEFCGQLGLDYTIEEEVIRIHRRKGAAQGFSTCIYRVADLVVPTRISNLKTQQGSAESAVQDDVNFESLIELIESTVEPGTWSATSGRVVPDKESCSLVIRQTDEVHGQVADLLSQLRQLQAVKIVTNVIVCRFKTQDQIGRLGRAVAFRNRSEGSKWALMPRAEAVTSLFDPSENEGLVSSSEIEAFVGQTADINLQIPGVSQLRVSLAGVPLAEDKFIRLRYGVDFDGGVEAAPPPQVVYQVVANGQTLLLDVTDAVLRAQVEARHPERPDGGSEVSNVILREKVKLATQIQAIKSGRIVVAITTSVQRRTAAPMAPANSDALRK